VAKERPKTRRGSAVYGPSGVAVWTAPTLDPGRDTMYVTTGDNYSDPTTPLSDAVVALRMSNGEILWSKQLTAGDAWNSSCMLVEKVNCPDSDGPDFDFAASAMLISPAITDRRCQSRLLHLPFHTGDDRFCDLYRIFLLHHKTYPHGSLVACRASVEWLITLCRQGMSNQAFAGPGSETGPIFVRTSTSSNVARTRRTNTAIVPKLSTTAGRIRCRNASTNVPPWPASRLSRVYMPVIAGGAVQLDRDVDEPERN